MLKMIDMFCYALPWCKLNNKMHLYRAVFVFSLFKYSKKVIRTID